MATVLVVDDNASNRELLVTLLGYRGHRVVEAADGAEALDKVRELHPDLVVSDIVMPTMDGFEFVRRLRSLGLQPPAPVIFYTACYLEDEARALGAACGVSRYITKPCEPEVILTVVDEALGLPAAPVPQVVADEEFHRQHMDLVTTTLTRRANVAVSRLMTLVELGQELVAARDASTLLQRVCNAARSLIGSRLALVAVPQDDENEMRWYFLSGVDPAVTGTTSPTYAALSRMFSDISPRRRVNVDEADWRALCLPIRADWPRSLLFVPLRACHPESWLYFASKLGVREFSEEDEQIALTVAAQAGVACENLRMYEEVRTSLADLERESAERHRAEEELRKTEAEYRQVQKLDALGQLAGGVAHDFNNMLTAILGYTEILTSQAVPGDPMLEALGEIRTAGERAEGLTRQLLAFSRKQVLQPKVLDPNEVVSGVEKMLRRLIGEDIELVTRLDPDAGRIRMDQGQLEQVLMNLALNARDAMPRGGRLVIETAARVFSEEEACENHEMTVGCHVTLGVSDTGCGMAPSIQPHIFEPFFTTKAEGRGTGLGLSTVYGIVKQSGGLIRVDSEPGKGSTFTVIMPQIQEAVEAAPVVPRQEPLPLGRGRVLVVEDEDAVRRLLVKVLEMAGYDVVQARNGEEALEICGDPAETVDLTLSDVVMPRMSGFDMARELTALRPGMKFLFLSGYADDTTATYGLDSTMPFLPKPVKPQQLAARVRELLEERK